MLTHEQTAEAIENLEHVDYLLRNLLDAAHDRKEKATVRQTIRCLDFVDEMIYSLRQQADNEPASLARRTKHVPTNSPKTYPTS